MPSACPHRPVLKLNLTIMSGPASLISQTPPVIPPSKFQLTFSDALESYKTRTGKDLLLHPLAARLQSCNSSGAILSVLREQAQAIDQSWNRDEKLAMWLSSTVDVIYALSSNLGESVGLVIIGACLFKLYLLLSFRYHHLQKLFLLASVSSSL